MKQLRVSAAAAAVITLAACHSAPAEPRLASTQVHRVLDKTPS